MRFSRGKQDGYYHYRHYSLPLLFTLALALAIPATAAEDASTILSRFQQYLQINTAQPHPNYYEAAQFITSQANSLSLHSQTLEFVEESPSFSSNGKARTQPSLPSSSTHIQMLSLPSITSGLTRLSPLT